MIHLTISREQSEASTRIVLYSARHILNLQHSIERIVTQVTASDARKPKKEGGRGPPFFMTAHTEI